MRVGEATGLSLAAALICALPTAIRTHGAGGGFADALLIGTVVMLWLLLPVGLLVPKARRGFRGVAGAELPRSFWLGVVMWVGLSVALLALVATALKATTNHRGLGGATFGVVGAGGVLVAALLAKRIYAIGMAAIDRRWPAWPLFVVAIVIGVLPVLLLGLPLLDDGSVGASTRAALLDLLLSVVVAVGVFRWEIPDRLSALLRLAPLPIAAILVAVGLWRIETSPAMSPLKQAGGVPAALLHTLEAWSDHDGDGIGAHFGGHDCDEGDPLRRPGADEVAGDGRDSNCDGDDDPPAALAAVKPTANAEASAATVHAKAAPKPGKPDIILVTLDTVRADRTSLYGYKKATTPTLKELANRGVVFEHAYATGSDSQRALMPLVSTMVLSKTPRTTKEWPRVRDEAETVAERLRAVGYATGAVTSFTWLRKDRGFAQGFDLFDESPWSKRHPEREHTGDLASAAATSMYAKLARGSGPLFLWLHMFDAHAKYVAHAGIDFGNSDSGRYDGEIAYVDKQLASFIDAVQSHKGDRRTLWLVHGSHGEGFGEHDRMTGHGTQLYDEVLRVPLLVVPPEFSSEGTRWRAGAVSTLDVAPTLLDYGGASVDGAHGVSLRRVVEGDTSFKRRPVLAYARRRTVVIDWPLKLMVFRRERRDDRLLLFDLGSDPEERRDVSADRRQDLQRLDAIRRATK